MENGFLEKYSDRAGKIAVMAILSLSVVVITVFCLSRNIQIVFTHLYYVPVIVAAYWYQKRGVIYTVLLSVFYLAAVWFLSSPDAQTLFAAFSRVAVFIGIAVVIALLSLIMRQQQEEITQSEQKFRGVWESIQAGIILVDAQTHTILAANPEAGKLSGYSEKEMIGKLCHKLICPAEEGKCPICDLGQKIDRAERVLLQRDGKRLPVLKTVAESSIGGRKYYIENFIDISPMKEAETTLIAYIREATLRIRNPVELVRDNLADIREELTGRESPPGYIATALAIQEKNMEGILKNLQELEQAIAEKRTEIPDAFREYLKR